MFESFSFEEKVKFVMALALCTKSLKYFSKVHKRRRYQFKELAAELILELNFWEMPLNH